MRSFPASPITALIDEKPVYNLGESIGPELTVTDVIGPEGLEPLANLTLAYGTSAGDATLRALVAERHGIPDRQVLITSGAAAGLFLLAVLCGDGEIVVGRPCYPPMLDALRGIGASVTTVQSRFEDGYRLDPDAFEATLSPRTQLVMFASPQNPSGVPLTDREVDHLLAAMSRACPEALLLIDETYREATYAAARPAPTFAGRSPQLLTCGSLSKPYGVGGLRIGWLTIPDRELYEQLRLAKFNAAISSGTLDEFLAAKLLSQADRLLANRGAHMAQARDIVEAWIDAHQDRMRWLRPQAGAFCCVQLDPATFGREHLDRLHAHLARQRTLLAPGPWFGDVAHVIRIGLAYEPADKLERALEVISAAQQAALRPDEPVGAEAQ